MCECETWTLKTKDERKSLAFKMRYLRRTARIKDTERMTNVQVRQRLESTGTILSNIKDKITALVWPCQANGAKPSPEITFEGSLHGLLPRGRA